LSVWGSYKDSCSSCGSVVGKKSIRMAHMFHKSHHQCEARNEDTVRLEVSKCNRAAMLKIDEN